MYNIENTIRVTIDDSEVEVEVTVAFNYSHDDGYDVGYLENAYGERLYWDETSNDLKERVYDALEDDRNCSKRFPAMSGAQCLKMFG